MLTSSTERTSYTVLDRRFHRLEECLPPLVLHVLSLLESTLSNHGLNALKVQVLDRVPSVREGDRCGADGISVAAPYSPSSRSSASVSR